MSVIKNSMQSLKQKVRLTKTKAGQQKSKLKYREKN